MKDHSLEIEYRGIMRNKIHVAHIVYSFDIGGMENGLVNLMNRMDPALFDFSLYRFDASSGSSRDRVTRSDVRYYHTVRRQGNDLSLPWRIARLLRNDKPEIVHTHGWPTYMEGSLAAKLAGVPFVIHGEHGTLYFDKKRRVHAYRVAARFTDRFLTVSKELSDILITQVGISPDKVDVIINGVDTSTFRPSAERRSRIRADLGLSSHHTVIGSVGRLVPVKRFDLLVGALSRITQKWPNVRGILVGDGPLRLELREKIRDHGLEKQVCIIEENSDIPSWMNAFDVFALPSDHEGISNTILEAMASGLPIVSTRVGGTPELVEHRGNGLLVPSGNCDALECALGAMLNNQDSRRRYGDQSRQRACKAFAIESMVQRYETLYSTVATNQGASYHTSDGTS